VTQKELCYFLYLVLCASAILFFVNFAWCIFEFNKPCGNHDNKTLFASAFIWALYGEVRATLTEGIQLLRALMRKT
jgi:hypothetical protein